MLIVLCLASLAPMLAPQDALNTPIIEQETTARADNVDFIVEDIAVGNTTEPAEVWEQPDSSSIDYLLRGTRYEVRITFMNAGIGSQGQGSFGTLQAVHPIGFVMESWEFNLTGQQDKMQGGQRKTLIVEWTADAAHSILDDDGHLHGGIIFRGEIQAEFGPVEDGPKDNNVYEEAVPVALWHDPMDGPSITYDVMTWIPISYTDRTPSDGSSGIYGGGSDWQTDNSSSAVGPRHYRISNPDGGNYASNTIDMLKWGWFSSDGTCNDPGHGLGYGTIDSDIEAITSYRFCWLYLLDSDFRSVHWATKAWGTMGSGDELAMEALRGMNTVEQLNLTQAGVSASENDWTNIVWNMTDVHDDNAYTISYTKLADNSGANEGMRIDDFILFATEVVDEYTVTLECDDPLPNAYSVIPADPFPPSLYCDLTNNGYREVNLNIFTEVSNDSWMASYPLRIESDNKNSFGNSVALNPLDGETTTSFWVNLTVPEGANVETLNWTVQISDLVNAEMMSELTLPVTVSSSYSVRLDQVTPALPALYLDPGESGDILMKVKNTGNQVAGWSFGAYFDTTTPQGIGWGANNLAWLEDWDEDGNFTEITQVQLEKGEERFVTARITAPQQNSPGDVDISLFAQGISPASAQSVEQVVINMSTIQSATVTPESSSMTALADGNKRTMSVTIRNDGNEAESFDLSINADWRIGASLAIDTTEPIEPFGQEIEVVVIMDMPQGLAPEYYPVTVTATSQTDSTYSASGQYTLEVPATYIVEVEDKDLSGQSFSAGVEARTMKFEIFNHGNEMDAFNIDLSMDAGMNAEISSGATDGQTTYIAPQTSTNVTISYSFDDGVQGNKELSVTATSVNGLSAGQSVSSTGVGNFQVGTLGWIRLEPGPLLHITEPGPHTIGVTVHNQHPSNNQEIRLSVSTDEAAVWNTRYVRVVSADQQFELPPDQLRIVYIEIYITDENLANFDEDTMVFTATLKVEATDDNAEVSMQFSADKFVATDSSSEEGGFGAMAANIGIWVAGILSIIALGVVLVRILMSTEHEEEISSLGGYESNIGLPDAPSLPEAPTLPSADTTANSMYGGTEDLFSQPVTTTPPPPSASSPVTQNITVNIQDSVVHGDVGSAAADAVANSGPQLPESGLPEGWTMEQWQHYGEEYLRRQGGA